MNTKFNEIEKILILEGTIHESESMPYEIWERSASGDEEKISSGKDFFEDYKFDEVDEAYEEFHTVYEVDRLASRTNKRRVK